MCAPTLGTRSGKSMRALFRDLGHSAKVKIFLDFMAAHLGTDSDFSASLRRRDGEVKNGQFRQSLLAGDQQAVAL
jgi:hypothetical protein